MANAGSALSLKYSNLVEVIKFLAKNWPKNTFWAFYTCYYQNLSKNLLKKMTKNLSKNISKKSVQKIFQKNLSKKSFKRICQKNLSKESVKSLSKKICQKIWTISSTSVLLAASGEKFTDATSFILFLTRTLFDYTDSFRPRETYRVVHRNCYTVCTENVTISVDYPVELDFSNHIHWRMKVSIA